METGFLEKVVWKVEPERWTGGVVERMFSLEHRAEQMRGIVGRVGRTSTCHVPAV